MAAPSAPVIRARSNGRDVVRVWCEVPTGTLRFKVYRDETGPATTLLATVTPSDLTVPFIYLDAVAGAAGLILHYRVKACNDYDDGDGLTLNDGDSAFSNAVHVATEDYSEGNDPTNALRINRT